MNRSRKRWWHTPFGNGPVTVFVWWVIWTPLFFGACTWASVILVWLLAQLVGWGAIQILTTPPAT